MRAIVLALAVFAVSAAAPACADENAATAGEGAEQESAAVVEAGRKWTEAFLVGDLTTVWDAMTPEMQAALGSEASLADLHSGVERDLGEEVKVISEEATTVDAYAVYLRVSQWSKPANPVLIQWAFDGSERIAGFFIRPVPAAAESRFLDYETRATLRLPFDGQWFVFWGGRTVEQNYHAVDRGQRFAYDFLVMDSGSSFNGPADRLDSYHCWGRPILAPAAGTVAASVDGLPDQDIGRMDPENPAGNHVVIDLGNDEFAFLAHLQQGSVTVSPGDDVAPGQAIGRCGNSGNTSEPHLHFHLQTTPRLGDGEGLPAIFNHFIADGVPVERGEPVRGQVVSVSRP